MEPATSLALLWVAFTVTHIGMSSLRLRPRLVAALGARGFQALYSAVAFAILIPLVLIYWGHKHEGPQLWTLPRGAGLTWTVYVLMGTALVFLVASILRPSPASMVGRTTQVRGIHRLTRHPTSMALALFGVAHILPNSFATDVAFFAGFAVFGMIGVWHQDRRKLADGPEGYAEFYEETPFFPFTGPETLRGLRELSPLAVAIGISLTILLRYFHGPLFGP